MSPYVEREDPGSTAAVTILIVLVALLAVFLLGYFLWYAPSQTSAESDRDIIINVPQPAPQPPDVDVNVPQPPPPDVNVPQPRGEVSPPPSTEGEGDTSSGNQ